MTAPPAAAGRMRRLWQSTPLRQALLLVTVFAALDLMTFGGAWLQLRSGMLRTLQAELATEIAGYDLAATPAALAAIVGAAARATDPRDTVIVFVTGDGRQTGNARAELGASGLRLMARPDARPLSAAGYLHEERRLAGGVLVVAVSLAPVTMLGQTMLNIALQSLLPTVVVSLGLAAFIARRTAARVEAMEMALNRLSAGDLTARVPPRHRGSDDLGRIAAGIDHMAERQEAATEALRQVSADIAHDLRTPLQRIGVLLQDLRARLPGDGAAADLASRAADEADRAVAVFRGMLQIARIEGKGPEYSLGPVDLGAVAAQVFELYHPVAEDAGDRLELERDPAPLMLTGHRDLLAQALVNLVENALNHTPPGSRIAITARFVAGGAELAVTDDGPGIPEAERSKVVRRLYRLEQSRTSPGHGLGLALVSAIAQLHGGALRLEDAEPGLRAVLRLPV